MGDEKPDNENDYLPEWFKNFDQEKRYREYNPKRLRNKIIEADYQLEGGNLDGLCQLLKDPDFALDPGMRLTLVEMIEGDGDWVLIAKSNGVRSKTTIGIEEKHTRDLLIAFYIARNGGLEPRRKEAGYSISEEKYGHKRSTSKKIWKQHEAYVRRVLEGDLQHLKEVFSDESKWLMDFD